MSEDNRKTLRDVLDELEDYFESLEGEIQEAVRKGMDSTSLAKPFIAGFTFNLGPEGKPSVQMFGNNPVTGDGVRSPINEQVVDDKNGTLRLLLEIPGVEKGDISVETTEQAVLVTAENDGRKYRAEVELKVPVKADSGRAEYKNGILEISFSLKDNTNKGFRRVNVV